MHIYYHGNRDAILFRSAPWRAGSREPLQETRSWLTNAERASTEIATGVTRGSNEVLLDVRDKTDDCDVFCFEVRLEGAQNFQRLTRPMVEIDDEGVWNIPNGQLWQVRRPSGFHSDADMLGSLLDFGQEKEVVYHGQNH